MAKANDQGALGANISAVPRQSQSFAQLRSNRPRLKRGEKKPRCNARVNAMRKCLDLFDPAANIGLPGVLSGLQLPQGGAFDFGRFGVEAPVFESILETPECIRGLGAESWTLGAPAHKTSPSSRCATPVRSGICKSAVATGIAAVQLAQTRFGEVEVIHPPRS